MRKKLIVVLMMIAMVMPYQAIKAEENDDNTIKITSIQLEQSFVALRYGETSKLGINMKPKKATYRDVKFKSMNDDMVTVSKKGVIKAKKDGIGKKVKVIVYSRENGKIRDRVWVRILPKINKDKKMIALTFDDGPNAVSTNRIVNTLKANGAVGTFFELGCNLGKPENRKAMKRAFDLGNEIGSHTINHKDLLKLSAKEALQENEKCLDALERLTGTRPTLMRPPYGAANASLGGILKMPMILWSVDTLDWDTLDPVKTYHSAMTVRDGGIVLMHSIYTQTADAVEKIVPALKKKGFQFVTVSELYRYKGVKMKNGKIYNGIRS